MKRLKQSFNIEFNYEVVFIRDLFSIENRSLLKFLETQEGKSPYKLLVIVDKGIVDVNSTYINTILNYTNRYSSKIQLVCEPIIIQGGEDVKNSIDSVFELLQKINEYKIDRHSYILGIGGGSVLDMVGFVASIAHRGIRHIRVPSTVLAQNDSGVGVKNGINYFGKKNFIGSFAPPICVFNDASLLTTLHDRDWRSGISEALKVALIKDEQFFLWIEENVEELKNRNLAVMEELIYRCAEMHLQHIATSGDPFEKGSSRPLDFGHWSAHKMEQLTNYQLRHGEAVAIGIALDVQYSALRGMLNNDEKDRVINLMENLGFDLFHLKLTNDKGDKINIELLKGLEEFREHLGGELTIMLLKSIGDGVEVHEMDRTLIEEAVMELKERGHQNAHTT